MTATLLGRTTRSRRLRLVLAGTVASALAALALLVGGDEKPAASPAVGPVPVGASPLEAARNLSAWLRANSG